jgi:hypothetical protein
MLCPQIYFLEYLSYTHHYRHTEPTGYGSVEMEMLIDVGDHADICCSPSQSFQPTRTSNTRLQRLACSQKCCRVMIWQQGQTMRS